MPFVGGGPISSWAERAASWYDGGRCR